MMKQCNNINSKNDTGTNCTHTLAMRTSRRAMAAATSGSMGSWCASRGPSASSERNPSRGVDRTAL
eukprot:scaffold161950_cov31-Prasinocladus_malaysianus.AAC.1